jgi:trans-2,3-dihydro-3-hydroxyanthranilate isomerase
MKRRYVTADVFTSQVFGGNPLAVVLDAEGLSSEQMQAIAREFNYSETTFVQPPQNPAHTARVRIFTPRLEVPFAGHPNVGTAFLLAHQSRFMDAALTGPFVFEELAGLVPVTLLREHATVVGAELQAPQALSRAATPAPAATAACLSLDIAQLALEHHAPQVVSVGLPFLVTELKSRDALRSAKPHIAAFHDLFPLDAADSIFAYWREPGAGDEQVLHARMFSPLDGIIEDPATGSAAAATIALLASLAGGPAERHWRIHQGVDMGRPSLLLGRTGAGGDTHIGGRCVVVLDGSFYL